MDGEHRRIIDILCKNFLHRLDMVKLWPKLLDNLVFNKDDINIPKWESDLTSHETIKDICLMIKTRGPEAYNKFNISLQQSNHENLSKILLNYYVPPSYCVNNNVEYYKNLQIDIKKAERFHDDPDDPDVLEKYPMRTSDRGFVLIIVNNYKVSPLVINNIKHDIKILTSLFESMNFQSQVFENLTDSEMNEKVQKISQNKFLHKVDCLFVIIISHEERSSSNDRKDLIDINYFTTEKCQHLSGKPKVFIFQTYELKKPRPISFTLEGNIEAIDNTTSIESRQDSTRNHEDRLILYVTLDKYNEDFYNGSLFTRILCDVFMNYAYEKHIQELLKIINQRISDLNQQINYGPVLKIVNEGFNRHCFLHPGLSK